MSNKGNKGKRVKDSRVKRERVMVKGKGKGKG